MAFFLYPFGSVQSFFSFIYSFVRLVCVFFHSRALLYSFVDLYSIIHAIHRLLLVALHFDDAVLMHSNWKNTITVSMKSTFSTVGSRVLIMCVLFVFRLLKSFVSHIFRAHFSDCESIRNPRSFTSKLFTPPKYHNATHHSIFIYTKLRKTNTEQCGKTEIKRTYHRIIWDLIG